MNINLGTRYEAIIHKIIEKEYAGNQTEAIRQALLAGPVEMIKLVDEISELYAEDNTIRVIQWLLDNNKIRYSVDQKLEWGD